MRCHYELWRQISKRWGLECLEMFSRSRNVNANAIHALMCALAHIVVATFESNGRRLVFCRTDYAQEAVQDCFRSIALTAPTLLRDDQANEHEEQRRDLVLGSTRRKILL